MDNDMIAARCRRVLWNVLAGVGRLRRRSAGRRAFPNLGIGFLGVAFAFGLTVLTMAYAVGHISGGHFNPAVTIGLWSAGRCASGHVIPYIVAQVIGAIVAAVVLWLIASGKPGWVTGSFASNGYGDLSPGKYGLGSCFLIEVVMTFFFLFIIIGTTSKGAAVGLRRHPDRSRADLDPSGLDPGHQHLGQPGAQHRAGAVRRRRIYRPALAVLGGADHRRSDRRAADALAVRAGSHRRNCRGRGTAGDSLTTHVRLIRPAPVQPEPMFGAVANPTPPTSVDLGHQGCDIGDAARRCAVSGSGGKTVTRKRAPTEPLDPQPETRRSRSGAPETASAARSSPGGQKTAPGCRRSSSGRRASPDARRVAALQSRVARRRLPSG